MKLTKILQHFLSNKEVLTICEIKVMRAEIKIGKTYQYCSDFLQ